MGFPPLTIYFMDGGTPCRTSAPHRPPRPICQRWRAAPGDPENSTKASKGAVSSATGAFLATGDVEMVRSVEILQTHEVSWNAFGYIKKTFQKTWKFNGYKKKSKKHMTEIRVDAPLGNLGRQGVGASGCSTSLTVGGATVGSSFEE